jgi:hypothetical protein
MKALIAAAVVTVLMGTAQGQQQPGGQTCMSQHVEAPGVSAAALISRGYDIKAAVPGGLWVQKDREVYFCNSGRALDNDVLCWRLREPVKGQICQ